MFRRIFLIKKRSYLAEKSNGEVRMLMFALFQKEQTQCDDQYACGDYQ